MNPDISRMLSLFGGFRSLQPVLQRIAADQLSAPDRNVWKRARTWNSAIQKIGEMGFRTAEEPSDFQERKDLGLIGSAIEILEIHNQSS
jgi:hypothetical protein